LNGYGGIEHIISEQNGTDYGPPVNKDNIYPEFIYRYPVEYFTRIQKKPLKRTIVQYKME
jgi:hypothetical protein